MIKMTINLLLKGSVTKCVRMFFVTALMSLVFAPSLFANNGHSAASKYMQQILNKKISVEVQDGSFADIMVAICKKADAQYSVKRGVSIDKNEKYTLNKTDYSVEDILKDFLAETKYDYTITDNKIIIVNRIAPVVAQQPEKIEVKGKIIDENNKPVVGATVLIDGTSEGAITDTDGNFIVRASNGNKIIVSCVGYSDATATVNGATLTITMQTSELEMGAAVVTGVFNRNQNTYSGATSSFTAQELQKTGSLNIITALGSLDPSFAILENNDMGSNPNATPDIQMRGAGSFSDLKGNYSTSPNQPLFIVDGFERPISTVLDMDMNRVKSITTLKDATAKALYGSKGANGVVVIETVAPKAGELQISYKVDLNIQTPYLADYNLTNATEKLEVERLAGMYTSSSGWPTDQQSLDEEYALKLNEVLRGVDTDWLSIPTRTGVGSKHSLVIEGGDDILRYSVNLALNNIQGAMKDSYRNTFEGGFNLQYRYKNVLFKEQFTILNNRAQESPYGDFSDYVMMNPYWRAYDSDGNFVRELATYERDPQRGYNDIDGDGVADMGWDIFSPAYNASTNYLNATNYTDLSNNFYIEWDINSDLKLVGRIGVTQRTTNNDLFYPSNYGTLEPLDPYNFAKVVPSAADDAYFKRGLYTKSTNEYFKLSSDITLNYSKQINNHLFFLNGQYSISTDNQTTVSYEGQGFSDSATQITQARQYKENSNPYGTDNRVNEVSGLVSANYSYDSRYFLDANYRMQASSLFGTNNRVGHFWSLGAGWNLHSEAFMRDINWLDQLKIRGSYGSTGSQNFSSYQALSTYMFYNNDLYDNVLGAYLMALSNPDLKWQQTLDTNIGFDLKVFNRLDVTVDVYEKFTKDLLTPITAAPSLGFSTYVQNLGNSSNKGIEAKINYRIIMDGKKDIMLNVFATAAHNKNKLVDINNALQSMNDAVSEGQDDADTSIEDLGDGESSTQYRKPSVEYAEGESLSAIWAVQSLGIDPSNGQEMFLKKDGTTTYEWDSADKIVAGDELPTVQGTFGVNLDYKGFTVNAILAYRLGGQFYNETLVSRVENADLQYNVDIRVFTDRWNPETPGEGAMYRELTVRPGNTLPTTRFVQDYNELKLSSLNIGYDFRNANFIKNNSFIERFRVSFAMNDVFRLSTVKTERGILYPYAQSFIFTAQATF